MNHTLPFDEPRTKLPYDFSPERAEAKKDEAVKRASQHANPFWKLEMMKVIRQVCVQNADFTADAIMELYAQDTTRPQTHNDRALGGLMKTAANRGYCVPTGAFRNSCRVSCHRRPLAVWRSLIYQENS